MKKYVATYEDFIPLGFGTNDKYRFSIGGLATQNTGYNMDAVVGPVMELSNMIAEMALKYENDENPNHKANEYLKEVKAMISEKIDSCYEECKYKK